ncbi:MAG: penicillin-binding protein 2 [Actinomycetota bacterium]|nr:penicillin-binding protein 2 [Actinomycetota bacterium]
MNDRSPLRILVLRVMVVSILMTLLGRLAYLQLAEGSRYTAAASNNRIREVVTPAARGQVLDDLGRPLVSNRTALVVSVTRSIVRSQPHRGKDVLARLAKVVGLSPAQIEMRITPCGEKLKDGTKANKKTGCWNGSPYQPVPIVSYASDKPAEVAKVLRIEEHAEDFLGVQAEYRAVREYPGRSLAAHVLGYLGPLSTDDLKKKKYQGLAPGTLIGRAGVEAVYDDRLRGTDGVQRLLVDKDSTVTGSLGTTPAVSGDNLVLSLDAGVQRVAETALAAGIKEIRTKYDRHRKKNFTASKGAAIVIEATTGRVVAMASYPSYDPTLFVGGISTKEYTALSSSPGDPLISNAVQGRYAPGSTFKLVSTAAAVAAGYSLTARVYPCPSSYKIGASVKHNFEGESFGTLDFRDTLIKSCDTVYYKLAVEQWSRDGATKNTGHAREVFQKMARAWGFGRQTGIDLPDERAGLITDRAYKQRFWDQKKKDYCLGAKTRPKGSYQQRVDEEFCSDGWRYNAGDAANFVIGQGDVLVTPLQLAMAYAALVNGGNLYRPQLAKGFLSADGRRATVIPPTRVAKVPVSKQVLDYIKSALAGVVLPPGTAKGSFAGFPLSQVAVGGKTGTADVNDKAPTSWFASFAPVSGSRYVTVVMVPEAGTGGTTAAPISRKIWDGIYGLEGAKRVLPAGGVLPRTLPVVLPDGSIGRPGTVLPRRPVTVVATPAPTTQALGGPPGLPWAQAPRRRSP